MRPGVTRLVATDRALDVGCESVAQHVKIGVAIPVRDGPHDGRAHVQDGPGVAGADGEDVRSRVERRAVAVEVRCRPTPRALYLCRLDDDGVQGNGELVFAEVRAAGDV